MWRDLTNVQNILSSLGTFHYVAASDQCITTPPPSFMLLGVETTWINSLTKGHTTVEPPCAATSRKRPPPLTATHSKARLFLPI